MQFTRQCSVDRMLDLDVHNLAAVVHDDVQFRHGLGLRMLAGNFSREQAVFAFECIRRQIATRRRKDFDPFGADQGDIAHDNLAADRQQFSQLGGVHRLVRGLQ